MVARLNNKQTVYIYSLTDPTSNELFYIGKSINPDKRLSQHISSSKYYVKVLNHGSPKERRICKILDCGMKPILTILEQTTAEYEKERESHWIRHFKNAELELSNMADTVVDLPYNELAEKYLRERLCRAELNRLINQYSHATTGLWLYGHEEIVLFMKELIASVPPSLSGI